MIPWALLALFWDRHTIPRTRLPLIWDRHTISTESAPDALRISRKIPSATWEALIPLVVRRQQPHRGTLDLQRTKNSTTTNSTNKQSQRKAQNTDLTRFGLVSYVLGARKGEGFYWFQQINTLTAMGIGKVLPLLYSPPQLHSKPFDFFFHSDLSKDTSQDTSKIQTLEIQHSP